MKVLITGATNGMGKGVARALAARDDRSHEVILLARSKERGDAVVREIQSSTQNAKVSFVHCDLTRLSDVRQAVAEIRAQHPHLDGIFVNAGLGYAARREETVDGMDSHFQVNYLSQFMLTLNLLELLERSGAGGRVIFNVTEGGRIFWDDLQMKKKWGYVNGIRQAMVAKRMFYTQLHDLMRRANRSRVSFYGFQIPKTVWSNQINIIPSRMRAMATVVKWFGGFISIDECGEIMAPLFTENQAESLKRSGKLITSGRRGFVEVDDDAAVSDQAMQDRLWEASLDLCKDENTRRIAEELRRMGRPKGSGLDPVS